MKNLEVSLQTPTSSAQVHFQEKQLSAACELLMGRPADLQGMLVRRPPPAQPLPEPAVDAQWQAWSRIAQGEAFLKAHRADQVAITARTYRLLLTW